MKTGFLAAAVTLAAFIFVPGAKADPIPFTFSGAGANGSGMLIVKLDTHSGDPNGAYVIIDASGTFSDSNIGISGATITGLVPVNPVSPPRGLPVPASMSLLAATGLPEQDAETGGISYDNLFYPSGSPITCPEYPFAGGFLDVYGMLLVLDNGDMVAMWSDGKTPDAPLSYGFGVIDPNNNVIDYQFAGLTATAQVPEPGYLWLPGLALLGLLVRRRRRS